MIGNGALESGSLMIRSNSLNSKQRICAIFFGKTVLNMHTFFMLQLNKIIVLGLSTMTQLRLVKLFHDKLEGSYVFNETICFILDLFRTFPGMNADPE